MTRAATRRWAVCLWSIMTASIAPALPAQNAWEITPGMRLQLHVADSARQAPFMAISQHLIGTLARATNDTLYLRIGGPDTLRVVRSTVQRVYLSRGSSRMRSALEQGFLAAVSSFVVVSAWGAPPEGRDNHMLRIGGAGLGLGLLVGAFRPYEHWHRLAQ